MPDQTDADAARKADHPKGFAIARRDALTGIGLMAVGAASAGLFARSASADTAASGADVHWLAGVPNGRDIGGITVADGKKIKTGIMFRTAALAGATPAGLAGLQKAGLTDIVDLRTDAEIKAQPDPSVPGATETYLNVFGTSLGMGVADFSNSQGTAETASAMMIQSYRQMVSLDSAHDAYSRFLKLALEGKPFAFHCTEGKDRTGWGAALLLNLLTASADQIEADYMLSNSGLVAQNADIEKQMLAANPNTNMAVLKVYLSVTPAFLSAAYDEANTKFGSLKGYVNGPLGFSDDNIAALKEVYLV